MADGKSSNVTTVLVALIAAGATVLAAVITAAIRSAPSPQPQPDPVPDDRRRAADDDDPMRHAWGNQIAALNHANLGAAFGRNVERLDTQLDGYAELQREDRNLDGFFELYRVDVNVDNLSDYYFDVNPFNGVVTPAPPR